jgi:hypothetical protein
MISKEKKAERTLKHARQQVMITSKIPFFPEKMG